MKTNKAFEIPGLHEVGNGMCRVNVNLKAVDGKYLFAISDGQRTHAAGELTVQETHPDYQGG